MAGPLMAMGVVLIACTGERAALSTPPPPPDPSTSETPTDPPPTEPPATEDLATTDPATTEATTTTTIAATTTAATTTTTIAATTTTAAATTTTVAVPVPGQPNPACFIVIQPGDSLDAIVTRLAKPDVTVEGLQVENAIANRNLINAGDSLDICIANDIDDITGDPWVPPPPPPPPQDGSGTNFGSGVQAQQQKLNELFGGTGFPELLVDGDSGRYTRRALCAARLALGLPVSRESMEPGGSEEAALMAAGSLGIPSGAATWASRWALIDQTCQVMFVGEGGNRVAFVFPTSTGEDGHETRNQSGSSAFRYNPASDNGGWHNSSVYPVPDDNPLNGNMYKPIYFDNGQAIHGANNVPPEPRSKGCARLRVGDQDALVFFLGLGDVDNQIWDAEGRIGLTVTVQGHF